MTDQDDIKRIGFILFSSAVQKVATGEMGSIHMIMPQDAEAVIAKVLDFADLHDLDVKRHDAYEVELEGVLVSITEPMED